MQLPELELEEERRRRPLEQWVVVVRASVARRPALVAEESRAERLRTEATEAPSLQFHEETFETMSDCVLSSYTS